MGRGSVGRSHGQTVRRKGADSMRAARLWTCLVIAGRLGARASLAQAPGTPPPPATPIPAPTPRPTPPTRDPSTPGYVTAKELPDGTVPPADVDGNFIIGPTHPPAPETIVQEGVPQGTVYKLHDELGRQQDLPGHRARPGHVRHAGSERSHEPDRDHEPPGALHAQRVGLRAEAVRAGHGGALHRGRRWSGRAALHDPRQPDRPEARAGR